jgi:hypothetical protein
LDTEKAQKIRSVIAEVVGFKADDIQDEDRFIADYRITYAERKALLERLNADFAKTMDFAAFCKLDRVGTVIQTFAE